MATTCPSCLRPVADSQTRPQTVETVALDDADVCSACGVPLPRPTPVSGEEIESSQAVTRHEVNDGAGSSGGQQVAHFQLRRVLGRGGFGAVWLAEDIRLGRLVALKLPRSTEKDAKLLHEAKTAARLKHPHIVSIFEVGVADNQIYIASEFIDGTNLRNRISSGRLPVEEVVRLVITITRAVEHAHQQDVVHRDLKPENILIDEDGRPHVTDFGIAKQLSENETISSDGQIVGTVSYMSPEQAEGNTRDTDRRSDVYAIGTILFELLTEFRPFRGNPRGVIHQKLYEDPPSPRKLHPGLPRDLETICLKCLQREPGRRYQTAGELADELERFEKGIPILARPVSRSEKFWRWCKRKPAVAGLLAGMLMSLSIGLIGISYFYRQALQSAQVQQAALYRTRMLLSGSLVQDADVTTLAQTLDLYETSENRHLRDFEYYYYRASMEPYLQVVEHGDSVLDVATTDDGHLFASVGPDRAIRVWSRESDEPLRTLRDGRQQVLAIDFSSVDERLVSANADGIARVWNPRQHDRVVHELDHGARLACARFDRSGKFVITIGSDGSLKQWHLNSNEEPVKSVQLAPGLVDLAVAENENWVAALTRGGRVFVWDVESQQIHREVKIKGPALSLSLMNEDQAIAVCGFSNSLTVAPLDGGESVSVSKDSSLTGEIVGLPQLGLVAFTSASGRTLALDHQQIEQFRIPSHNLGPGVIDYAPDAMILVVGGGDGTVTLIDCKSMKDNCVHWHESHVRDIAFLDSDRVATCTGDGEVRLWNLGDDSSQRIVSPSGREMLALSFDRNQDRIYACGMEPELLRIDPEESQRMERAVQSVGGFAALDSSPGGGRIAAGSRSGALVVLDVTNNEMRQPAVFEFTRPNSQVSDLAFLAGTGRLAVAYTDNTLVVYDVDRNEEQQ